LLRKFLSQVLKQNFDPGWIENFFQQEKLQTEVESILPITSLQINLHPERLLESALQAIENEEIFSKLAGTDSQAKDFFF